MATWAILFAGCFISLVPTYQQLTHNYKSTYGGLGQMEEQGFKAGDLEGEKSVQARACATIGEQNRYGQNMLILLPLGYFRYLREKSKRLRALALIFTGGCGMGFLLTFSRGGILALAFVMVLMAFMRLFTRRHVMIFAGGAVLTLFMLPQYLDRIASFAKVANLESKDVSREAEPDGAVKGRVTEMLAAAMVFADHPVLGVGSGMFKFYSQEYGNRLGIRRLEIERQAHCLYLDIAAENGALGLACFMGIVLMIIHNLTRARAHHRGRAPAHCPDEDATPYLLAIVCYLASGLFLHLSFIRFFFVLLALAAAAGRIDGPAGEEVPAASTAKLPVFVH
jgi:O-antigen ligase